jgi:hypothetical protein
MNFYRGGAWVFRAFEDCPAIYTNRPPCRFHRWMWFLLLGVKWVRDDLPQIRNLEGK